MNPLSSGSNNISTSIGANNDKQPVWVIVTVVIIGFILQVALSPNIAINGISPNILLICLGVLCLFANHKTCIVLGFVMGLLFDLLGSGPIGAMSLVMAVVGYFLPMVIKSTVQADSFVPWIIAMAIASLLASFAYCVVCAIIGYEESFFSAILFKVLPWTLYDIVIAAIFWPIAKRLSPGRAKAPSSRQISF